MTPSNKKMWNQADVRAEMNRMVKEATDACKTLHDVAGRISALGGETGFVVDAQVALNALSKRVVLPPAKTAGAGVKITAAAELGAVRGRMVKTWGECGCTCALEHMPASSWRRSVHAVSCALSRREY